MSDELHALRTCIQPYEWGSRTFLSGLRGESSSPRPEAELWIGMHANGPSEVVTDEGVVGLADWIAERPRERLGVASYERFGPRLPFLLKILAIEAPLSIQLHPNAEQAAAGFAAGAAAYSDDRHKPELIVALTPLVALRGLRTAEEIVTGFTAHGLADLLAGPLRLLIGTGAGESGLGDFVAAMLRLDGAVGRMALEQVAAALDPRDPVESWIEKLLIRYPGDVGALAPLWMNLVEISPGEALYQAPGVLHAYLVGAGIEIMADSDNVVRAALTAKPRDVDELLRLVVAESGDPGPVRAVGEPRSADGECWPTEAAEFSLRRMVLRPAKERLLPPPTAIEIYLCTRGVAVLEQARSRVELSATQAAVRSADSGAPLAVSGDADLWVATVPDRA